MALDWDAWIGQEEEPQEQSRVITPPPVLDDLIQQATEEDLQLENKIKEFTSDDVTIPRPKTFEEYPDKLVLSPVLVDGLFRKGRKGILTADAKAGKSFFAIELAICVSAGHPFQILSRTSWLRLQYGSKIGISYLREFLTIRSLNHPIFSPLQHAMAPS